MKKLILTIVILAIGGIIAWRFATVGEKEETLSIQDVQREKGVPVEVFEVQPQSLERWRDFTGTVEGIRQVNLFTNSAARVMQILKEEGDAVKKGEIIIRLDPMSGSMSSTAYESAKLNLDSAKRNYDRIKNLYEAGAVSKAEFENIGDALELAKAALSDTTANLDIKSPISGVVTEISTEVGSNADSGQGLAVVADISSVKIKLDVSQNDIKDMVIGQQVRCLTNGNGQTCILGEVSKIALSASPVTRLFAVETTMKNSNFKLKPGVIESVQVLLGSVPDALAAPTQVIINDAKGLFTYRIDSDDIAHLVPIEIGLWAGEMIEIKSGVKAGDRLVSFGQNLLAEGTKANVVKVNKSATD